MHLILFLKLFFGLMFVWKKLYKWNLYWPTNSQEETIIRGTNLTFQVSPDLLYDIHRFSAKSIFLWLIANNSSTFDYKAFCSNFLLFFLHFSMNTIALCYLLHNCGTFSDIKLILLSFKIILFSLVYCLCIQLLWYKSLRFFLLIAANLRWFETEKKLYKS